MKTQDYAALTGAIKDAARHTELYADARYHGVAITMATIAERLHKQDPNFDIAAFYEACGFEDLSHAEILMEDGLLVHLARVEHLTDEADQLTVDASAARAAGNVALADAVERGRDHITRAITRMEGM